MTSNYDNWEYHMMVERAVGCTCVRKLGEVLVEMSRR